MKNWGIVIFVALVGTTATANQCKDILKDFAAMKKAQTEIVQSLASNHYLMAQSVQQWISEVEKYKNKLPNEAYSNLGRTAVAFERRGAQAEKTKEKLTAATDILFQELQFCLKGKSAKTGMAN